MPRAGSSQSVHQKQRRHHSKASTPETEEDSYEDSISLPYRTAYDMAEKLATTKIGQYFLKSGDRLLNILETTAKWSLPQDLMEHRLQRPLPWLPFLMIIIALRLTRIGVSIGALFIGNSPIKAQDVVYFVQTRRRKLRALRLRGAKEINRRLVNAQTRKPGHGENTFVNQLKRFFSSAICRPGMHREPEHRIPIMRKGEKSADETDCKESRFEKRLNDEPKMSCKEMLNTYATANSEDDSDFVPNPDDASSEETSDASETNEHGDSQVEAASSESETNKVEDRHSSEEESVELKENGNGEPVEIPKPIVEVKQEVVSDTDNSEMAKTPHANGPSNTAENRTTDVAFKFVLTPPEVENGNRNRSRKDVKDSENGETKAGDKNAQTMSDSDRLFSILKSKAEAKRMAMATTATAPEILSAIDLTSNDTSRDTVDTGTSSETDSETNLDFSSLHSSPTLSAASSATLLDSFINNDGKDTAASTSTSNNEAGEANDLNSFSVASVSSSEDDFYSPSASPPPDSNSYQSFQMQCRASNIPVTINQQTTNRTQRTVSEPQNGDESTTSTFQNNDRVPRYNQHQNQHGNNQGGRFYGRKNRH